MLEAEKTGYCPEGPVAGRDLWIKGHFTKNRSSTYSSSFSSSYPAQAGSAFLSDSSTRLCCVVHFVSRYLLFSQIWAHTMFPSFSWSAPALSSFIFHFCHILPHIIILSSQRVQLSIPL
uniref:Uncharacterized protein n=1 Tax=Cacopsylla melanoneura TaxID=428564 RepID=A0A8D8Q146_9HEMI